MLDNRGRGVIIEGMHSGWGEQGGGKRVIVQKNSLSLMEKMKLLFIFFHYLYFIILDA